MAMRPEGSQAPGTFAASVAAAPSLVDAEGGRDERTVPLEKPVPIEKLVEQNLPWLQGWLRGRIRDPGLVHDICQESFLKALRSAAFLKDPARFPGWLFRIAQNTLRDHLRRKARRRRWFLPLEDLDAIAADEAPDALEFQEESARLVEAVRRLPPKYRDPLILRHAQDLSYAEIGKILGLSENAVQVRVFRAR